MWDLQSGQELLTLTGFSGAITTCAIQGNLIITGSKDCSVKVWRLTSLSEEGESTTHENHLNNHPNPSQAGSSQCSASAQETTTPSVTLHSTPSIPFSAHLVWSSNHPLHCPGLKLHEARNLSPQNKQLLKQQGALLQTTTEEELRVETEDEWVEVTSPTSSS